MCALFGQVITVYIPFFLKFMKLYSNVYVSTKQITEIIAPIYHTAHLARPSLIVFLSCFLKLSPLSHLRPSSPETHLLGLFVSTPTRFVPSPLPLIDGSISHTPRRVVVQTAIDVAIRPGRRWPLPPVTAPRPGILARPTPPPATPLHVPVRPTAPSSRS